jgi:hypothetical protein
MVSRLRRHQLAGVWGRVPAAFVRVRRRSAFAFEAAIRGLLVRRSSREAVERPDKQNDRHQADHDVNATSHPV